MTLPCPPRRLMATPNKGPGLPGPLSFWGGKSGPSVPLRATWDRFSNRTHRSQRSADPGRVAPVTSDGSGRALPIPTSGSPFGDRGVTRAGSSVRCLSQSLAGFLGEHLGAIGDAAGQHSPAESAPVPAAGRPASCGCRFAMCSSHRVVMRDPARVTANHGSFDRTEPLGSVAPGGGSPSLPAFALKPNRSSKPLGGWDLGTAHAGVVCRGSCRPLEGHGPRAAADIDTAAWQPSHVTRPGSLTGQAFRLSRYRSLGRTDLDYAFPSDPARVSTPIQGGLAMT